VPTMDTRQFPGLLAEWGQLLVMAVVNVPIWAATLYILLRIGKKWSRRSDARAI
jgi:hypothetical protein